MKMRGALAWGLLGGCLMMIITDQGVVGSMPFTRLKDAHPKHDKPGERSSLIALRERVSAFEQTLTTAQDEINAGLSKQDDLLKRIESEVAEIRTSLLDHGDQLDDISGLAGSKDHFALSNHTCGGILIGKSGYIVYGDDYEAPDNGYAPGTHVRRKIVPFHKQMHPTSCIWTIRADNRENIKLTTHTLNKEVRFGGVAQVDKQVYVMELTRAGGNTSTLNISTTILKPQRQYMFAGPVVFLVYSKSATTTAGSPTVNLHVQFEGVGNKVNRTTRFTHNILKMYGDIKAVTEVNFTEAGMKNQSQVALKSNYTTDLITLTVANYSTTLLLRIKFDKGQCTSPDDRFVFFRVDEEDGNTFTDCCASGCKGAFVLTGSPGLFLISKRFEGQFPFAISWETEKAYPSDSSYLEHVGYPEIGTPCGEILGGMSGTIRYNPNMSYRNNERCIWTLVPQPSPRSSFRITIVHDGIESYYDKLYAVQFIDTKGQLLPNGPRISRLFKSYSYRNHTHYHSGSREVFIVFYSDGYVVGTGFSLTYEFVGSRAPTEVLHRFSLLKHAQGTASATLELDHAMYHVFAVAVRSFLAYSHTLKLYLNMTEGSTVVRRGDTGDSNGCLLSRAVTVFTTHGGSVQNASSLTCDQNGQISLEAEDGFAFVVVNNTHGDVNATFHLSWEEGIPDGSATSMIITNENACGGLVEGEAGRILYKPTTRYNNLDRCVWVIQAPGRSQIDLRLIKDGFESCCDYLVVSTVTAELDPPSTQVKIKRDSPTATINSSIAIVMFQSDTSTVGTGFVLAFQASGTSTPGEPTFTVIHRNESSGSFSYPVDPSDSDEPMSSSPTLIFAYSSQGSMDNDDTQNLVVSFDSGELEMITAGENGSQYVVGWDRLSMYTFDNVNRTWLRDSRKELDLHTFLEGSMTNSSLEDGRVEIDPKPSWFQTAQATFLAVFRPAGNAGLFSFSWRRASGCGGIQIGESGVITYKDGVKYRSTERCLWLIEVPKARRIRVTLENHGFERCCDYLLVGPVTPQADRFVYLMTRVGGGERMVSTTLVEGPVIALVFRSDDSVEGTGFRVTFSRGETMLPSDPRITNQYHLSLENNVPGSHAFGVKPSDVVILGHVGKRYPSYSSTVTYHWGGNLDLSVFRPYLSASCESDSFALIQFESDPGTLVKSMRWSNNFTAARVYNSRQWLGRGRCEEVDESRMSSCNTIGDCRENPASNRMVFSTNNFGIVVAIYRAVGGGFFTTVNDTITTGMRVRGFKMDFSF